MPQLFPFYYLCQINPLKIMELLRYYYYTDFAFTPTMVRYFYHPDHTSTGLSTGLGSSSWITDNTGRPIQHLHYLPFGEDWVDQRNTSWSAPYTFSGKEKDVETGYGYFGARYYDSGLSIWLSVDPMSDKYPSMSPYNYCANNPVILVDPDGRDIVDPDGNICYTKQDGWLPNAPEDTKRIGNAMMETETGKEQFNNLVDSKTKIQLKISQEDRGTIMGNYDATDETNGRGNVTLDSEGNIVVNKAVITIFEGSISKYLDGSAVVNIDNCEGVIADVTRRAQPDVNQYIGAVAGHEAEHNTQENLQLNASRSSKVDHSPEIKKLRILNELIRSKL